MDPSVQAALIAQVGLMVVAFLQLRGQRQQNKMKQKVEETHHQVTTNGHSSAEPTILDKINDISDRLDAHLDWHAEVPPGKHRK